MVKFSIGSSLPRESCLWHDDKIICIYCGTKTHEYFRFKKQGLCMECFGLARKLSKEKYLTEDYLVNSEIRTIVTRITRLKRLCGL